MDKSRPDEVYHLAGQSHVQISFDLPEYTGESTALGTLRLLEVLRRTGRTVRFYQAATSEIYGEPEEVPQTERTHFRPVNPYAAAKLYAFSLVGAYRRAYDLHASNGILFNHESPYRGGFYVTRKIVRAAAEIAAGQGDRGGPGQSGGPAGLGLRRRLRAGDVPDGPGRRRPTTTSSRRARATRCATSAISPSRGSGSTTATTFGWTQPSSVLWTSPRPEATRRRHASSWGGEPSTTFEELVTMMVDAELERIDGDD